MLHNDGPYGPNEGTDNLGAHVNIGPINSSSNLSNNMNNLGKIAQQPVQGPSGRYHLPDFSSYSHQNINLSPQLSAYSGYSPMGFQPSYPLSNTASVHNTNWQSNMLQSHLNQHQFNNQNMLNYPAQYPRTSQNSGYSDTSLAKNMSMNYLQVPTKHYEKADIEPNCSQYSVNHRKYEDYSINSDPAPKSQEKPLLDSTKRKNLENTVRLIEDILSNTVKNKEMQKSQILNNLLSGNKSQESIAHKDKVVSKLPNKLHETSAVLQNDYSSTNSHENSHHSHVNRSMGNKTTDYYAHSKEETESFLNSDKSEFESGNEKKYKKNNNLERSDFQKVHSNDNVSNNKTGIIKTEDKVLKKEHNDLFNQKDPLIKVEVDNENIDLERELITQIDVKVEPVFWHDFEDMVSFQRDVHGKSSEEIGSANVIAGDDSVNAAKEAITSGSGELAHTFYACSHCGLHFSHPKRFLVHVKWHGFGLTNERRAEEARERQAWREQRREERVMNKKLVAKEKVKPESSGETLTCKDCHKEFRSKNSLKNHRHRHHPSRYFECEVCQEQILGMVALKAHSAAHSTAGPAHRCPHCDKRFVYAHSLTKHSATHLEKTLQCPQCPKKFGTNSQLKMHQKVHERAERGTTFRCSYCAKGFYESYNLMVHERTHRGERPFLCDICHTSYGTNSSLKRHLKVSHSTSKPFECATCHRSFAAESTRNRHQIRAHGDPEQMSHHCHLCGNRYIHQRDLTKHVYKAHKKGKKKKVSDSE